MTRAARPVRCAAALGCGLRPPGPGAAPPTADYQPDRHDYAAFRAAWPDLHEPNYLPFMSHRVPRGRRRCDALVFCRWDEAMPLPVHVAAPEIPDSLQDEFELHGSAGYVAAVDRALATWEREMEGLVRFRRVDDPAEARIEIALRGEAAPVATRSARCSAARGSRTPVSSTGRDPDAERLRVRFEVGPLTIYVADEFGLLSQDQVEWIALHEIGHALGMRAHSPIPADLMYEVVRDRVLVREGLSLEDVELLRVALPLPNGTIYARGRRLTGAPPTAPPPTGPPMLALAPHVDSRHGFRVRLPYGWMRVETAQGVAAVDGVTWDYSASYQVVVSGQPTLDAYLERYGAWYAGRGQVLGRGRSWAGVARFAGPDARPGERPGRGAHA